MKRQAFIFLAVLITVTCHAQHNLTPVDAGSKVNFVIKNFGLNTNGSFTGLKGSISYNPANVNATVFNVTVDANTINTDNKKRDAHLRKDEYFDAEKFPVLLFKSTKVSAGSDGSLMAEGTMTIKGVSKKISFPFKVSVLSVGYLFQGSFELNRRDFGVGGSSAVMADNLKVSLSVFAK
ncbi:MAG: YceI family protein [Bacteroidota bacterium]